MKHKRLLLIPTSVAVRVQAQRRMKRQAVLKGIKKHLKARAAALRRKGTSGGA